MTRFHVISRRRRLLELVFPWLRWRRERRVAAEIRRLVCDAPHERVIVDE